MGSVHEPCADKWRIADDVVSFGDNGLPVDVKGVSFANVAVTFEREKIQVAMNNLLSFLNHLEFSNPKGGLSYGNCEVINFNAVKLGDRNFNGVIEFAESDLTAENFFEDFIFKAAET